MAREYGKNWFTTWTDDDFCAQPIFDKLLFKVLLGQPPTLLNYAGFQPISMKRWRKAMRDGDVLPPESAIQAALIRMESRRYVYTDDETSETLIRSFIRRDGIDKQPWMLVSALNSAACLESPKLAAVLLRELTTRIELPEIKGDSSKSATLRESLKRGFAEAVEHLEGLSKGLTEPFPKPFAEAFPEGLPKPYGEGFGEGLSRPGEIEPFPKVFGEGFGQGTVVVGVGVRNSPSVGGYVGGERERADVPATQQPQAPGIEPPAPFCPKHMPDGTDDRCGACAGHRKRRQRYDEQHAADGEIARRTFLAEVAACTQCDAHGWAFDEDGEPIDPVVRCPNHDWSHLNA